MDQAQPWMPFMQYGALGLCGMLCYGIYYMLKWLMNRDTMREDRMAKSIEDQNTYVQKLMETVIKENTVAVNRMVDLENRVINCQEETTIILRDLGRKIGSGLHTATGSDEARGRKS